MPTRELAALLTLPADDTLLNALIVDELLPAKLLDELTENNELLVALERLDALNELVLALEDVPARLLEFADWLDTERLDAEREENELLVLLILLLLILLLEPDPGQPAASMAMSAGLSALS